MKKRIILTAVICATLIVFFLIGIYLHFCFKPVGGALPNYLYIEDDFWGFSATFVESPPEKTHYVGEIKHYLPSGIPEENFTSNEYPVGSKIYKATFKETYYIKFVNKDGLTMYASYKRDD